MLAVDSLQEGAGDGRVGSDEESTFGSSIGANLATLLLSLELLEGSTGDEIVDLHYRDCREAKGGRSAVSLHSPRGVVKQEPVLIQLQQKS